MARGYDQFTKSPDVKKSDTDLREQLLQEKTLWSFNQWFTQIGQKTKVTPHLDLIEGVTK
jgi:hypothetical protein